MTEVLDRIKNAVKSFAKKLKDRLTKFWESLKKE